MSKSTATMSGAQRKTSVEANGDVTASCLETALLALRLGLSPLPAVEDGTKSPLADLWIVENGRRRRTWKPYQETPATEAHVLQWYSGDRRTAGLATGVGGIECFEFDCRKTYESFLEVARNVGLADLVERVREGYEETTPGGGVHWLWYCDELRGSTKLAQRPNPQGNPKIKTLIETKGQGGFVIIAPSSGPVHPTGGAYVLQRGGLDSVAMISGTERDVLWDLARTFDEMDHPTDPDPGAASTAPRKHRDGEGKRPGDDFEDRATWADILEPFGWKLAYTKGEVGYWRRPEKTLGSSATTGHCKGLKVFSSSTPFDTSKTYSKLGAHAVLTHAGDMKATVKALVENGYGTWLDDDGTEHPNPRPKGSRRNGQPSGNGNGNGDGHQDGPPGPKPIVGGKGLQLSCLHNSVLWLDKQEDKIRFDTFHQIITVGGVPLVDETIIGLQHRIESDTGSPWSLEPVRNAVTLIAYQNTFNSLTDWLDGLKWDGVDRIGKFFSDTFNVVHNGYAEFASRVFFLGAVARAFKPGCKMDTMPVLIGRQGILKSSTFRALVPEETLFTDDLGGDLFDKKPGEGLRGKWIIEFSEFARINRSTSDVVKSFLSRQSDHYRPPYGRIAKDFPRSCVFVGTTNNHQPLHDDENRRFLPLVCGEPENPVAYARENRDQLWAEAVHRYRQGERWWTDDSSILDEAKEAQDVARAPDVWEDILEEALRLKDDVTLPEVVELLRLPIDRCDKGAQTRIGLILRNLGFTRKTRARSGDRPQQPSAWHRE